MDEHIDLEYLEYFERDFTVAPTKIINIKDYPTQSWHGYCTELNNGMILHNGSEKGKFGLANPRIVKNDNSLADPSIVRNDNKIDTYNIYQISDFLEKQLYEEDNTYWLRKILDFDGQLFMLFYDLKENSIMVVHLDDFTLVKIAKLPQSYHIYPLRNKRILFFLDQSNDMLIFNLTTGERTQFKSDPKIWENMGDAEGIYNIHELSSGDIILNYSVDTDSDVICHTTLYHININDGVFREIASYDYEINIIAILKNDNLLLCSVDLDNNVAKIELWINLNFDQDQNSNDNSNYQSVTLSDFTPHDDRHNLPASVSLHNGNVFFYLADKFYLFTVADQKLINLPLMENRKYLLGEFEHCEMKLLRNGNILIDNYNYLTILEFPINQRYYDRKNYDNIDNIILSKDIKGLIRNYI